MEVCDCLSTGFVIGDVLNMYTEKELRSLRKKDLKQYEEIAKEIELEHLDTYIEYAQLLKQIPIVHSIPPPVDALLETLDDINELKATIKQIKEDIVEFIKKKS